MNKYVNKTINILKKDPSPFNGLKNLISSYSGCFISDFIVPNELLGNEIYRMYKQKLKYNKTTLEKIKEELDPKLLTIKNLNKIKDYNIIYLEGSEECFNLFYTKLLPKINKKIILISSGAQTQIHNRIDERFKSIINNDKICLWYLKNKRINHPKSRLYPIGICIRSGIFSQFINSFITNNEDKKKYIDYLFCTKNEKIKYYLRNVLPERKPIDPLNYFNTISNLKFIISPYGVNPDCYRHLESVGLGTIPIVILNKCYDEVYKNSYINLTDENIIKKFDMGEIDKIIKNLKFNEKEIKIIEKNGISGKIMVALTYKPEIFKEKYFKPNRDIICLNYWKDRIKNDIKNLQNNN